MSATIKMASGENVSTKAKRASKPKAPAKKAAAPDREMRVLCYGGVGFLAALSAILNGWANAQHAPMPIQGWVMGISVPVIVLVLSRIAGKHYKAGRRNMAYGVGATVIGLLLLSVWHCSVSIAAWTGSPIGLAIPMAIAIDAGLVWCEISPLAE